MDNFANGLCAGIVVMFLVMACVMIGCAVSADKNWKNRVVEHGYAEYSVNETGETTWNWITEENKGEK